MTKIITNIQQLVNLRTESQPLRGSQLADLPCLQNAYLVLEGEEIAGYGEMKDLHGTKTVFGNEVIDAKGARVLPAWCDSHTHIVFAASREAEFVDKIKGLSYAEIANRGGGILNSAAKLNATNEDALFASAWKRLEELSRLGTGAVEIKSGYGLSVEGELKMLRVIRRLKEKSNLSIKTKFLRAHGYPLQYRDHHDGYIDSIINEMLPVIGREGLADYIDVFCETGFVSPEEMEKVCRAGMQWGLKPKLHVNQLNSIGGIEKGIDLGALTMDHLETVTEEDIEMLAGVKPTFSGNLWKGISTLLPSAAFFLRMPLQPARRLIDSGAAVALASDYNPGSSPSGNMNLVVALSCIQMRMLPQEAINAATLNGAYAMGLGNELGSISIGKKANLIFTKPIPSLAYFPYSFGSNLIDRVMIRGEWIS